MPIYFEAKSECGRCGKTFAWVHYEMARTNIHAGRLKVERLPSAPWARTVRHLTGNKVEYTVACAYCGCVNRYVYDKNDDKQKCEDV